MKKVLSLVLALVLVLGMIPTFAAGTGAEELKANGFISGNESGDLLVDQALTREQLAALTAELAGEKELAAQFEQPAVYADSEDISSWAVPFVAYAQEMGWMTGIAQGTETVFKPMNVVSGPELAATLMNALGYTIENAAQYATVLADAAELGMTLPTGALTREVAFEAMWVAVSEVPMNGSEMTLGVYLGRLEPATPVVTDLKVESVTALNLGEVEVAFNNEIDEDTLDVDNFAIEDETIEAVTLSEDGKAVIVSFLFANKLDNQAKYTLEIDEIADVDGSKIEDYEAEFATSDFTAPVVESVTIKGNKKLEITFSEPVSPVTSQMLSNYRINDLLFGAAITAEGRVVSLDLTARLPEGVHKLTVSTDVTDFAGYKVVANNTEFAVAKDEVKPALATVVSATQQKVVITFTKPVEKFDASALVGGDATTTANADDTTWTLKFASPFLPLAGTELTLEDVTDFYGNVTDEIKFNVVPTIDLTRPEVKSVVVEDQDEIIVTFTKDIDLATTDATFVLEDADGDETTLTAAYDTDEDGNIQSVVILTAGDDIEAGTYTLEVTGFKDTTPLANSMVPYAAKVAVADLTKPQVTKVSYTAATKTATGSLYVEFSEKLNPATALDKANYSFVSNTVPVAVGSSHGITLLGDNKTVKITVPKLASSSTLTTYPISSLTVMNVTDTAGNKMVSSVTTTIVPVSAANIVFGAPVATGVSTVVIPVNSTLDRPIDPATVTASDFVVKYNNGTADVTLYVVNAVYDGDDEEITLTLNNKLTKAAEISVTAGDFNVSLFVVAKNLSDIYGNKVSTTDLPALGLALGAIADEIRPEGVKVASATFVKNTTTTQAVIVINLDEELDATTLPGTPTLPSNLIVEINGKLVSTLTGVTETVAYAVNGDGVAQLTITIDYPASQATLVGKAYSVKYFSTGESTDLSGNALKDFTFTGSLKAN